MVDRLFRWLLAERKPSFLYALAAVAGLAMAWYLLGWDGINGTSRYWETTHNDSLQGIAALRYYLAEPWSWSFLDVSSYGAPEGTNLILADSIPILAVAAKLVRFALPDGFHYFGYWMAFCFAMQAVAVVMLLSEIRWRNMLAMIAASSFALLQTVLLGRFFHVALMAQFVIVLTLLLGIRLIRRGKVAVVMWQLSGLLVAVFFIHLYLFAMVVPLAAAFVIQAGAERRLSWVTVSGWLAGVGTAAAALVAVIGLAGAASENPGGLGYYSLNLLAPVSRSLDATGGQYEGHSYVGLGLIGLGVAVLVLARTDIAAAVRRYWVLVLVAVLMTVFALSPTVWIGESVRLELPWFGPLEWFGERFRSTGRFVWPLVYVALIGALWAVHRRVATRQLAAIVLFASIVQVADMVPLASDVGRILSTGEEDLLPVDRWSELIATHDLVRIVSHECVVGTGDTSFASREVQRMTARLGVPVTAAAVARQQGDCDDPAFGQPLATGELRIVWAAMTPDYQVAEARCVEFDLGTACSLARDGKTLAALDAIGVGLP